MRGRKLIGRSLLVGSAAIAMFSWGAASVRFQAFPYRLLSSALGSFGDPPARTATTLAREEQFSNYIRAVDLVFLGDSLTANGNWDDMFPSLKVANRGISGDTSAGLLKRIDAIIASEPTRAYIMIGTNDLMRGEDLVSIMDNYDHIVRSLTAANTEVIIQSTIDCLGCAWRADIAGLNEKLKSYAMENGFRWIDLNSALSDETGALRQDLTIDGVHLNAAGYEVWRAAIAQDVNRSINPNP